MNKLCLLVIAGLLCAAELPLQATTLNYTLGTTSSPGYLLTYTSGTGEFLVTGGFDADPSTASGMPLSMSTNGTAFVDFTDLTGTYFTQFVPESYSTSANPSGVDVSSTNPVGATVDPVWTFDQQFLNLAGKSDYYTLELTGTMVDLYQSTSSSSLGTLIASGTETGAYPTNLPNPTPEPGTVGVCLAGLVAIAVGRYTRAREN